jgi:hypothetical protein
MRWLILMLIAIGVVGGCEHGEGGAIFCLRDGEVHQPGDFFPAGDGCNFCSCESNGDVTCSTDTCNNDGGIRDGGGGFCVPNGFCSDGVECNGQCCGPGESCNQGFCTCGQNAPCIQGDICATGGPVGEDGCGSICCGVTTPCPL